MRTVNSIRSAVMGLAAALSLTLSAQVKMMNQPIPPNGDFSQGFWQDVPEQSGFVPLKSSGKTKPGAQTAFKVAADADNVYLNIRCYEPKMNELKKTDNPAGLWGSDLVEIFLCPSGQPDDYYQFAATAGQDRTIYEDAYIFAANLYDMGLMETRDYQNYQQLFELMSSFLQAPMSGRWLAGKSANPAPVGKNSSARKAADNSDNRGFPSVPCRRG